MKVGSNPPILPQQPIERSGPLWEAAQGMEAQFMREMLRNMRKTVQESPETANNRGVQIFRGMLDDQYAERAVKHQGIGLAEVIVRQVLDMQQQQAMPSRPSAAPTIPEAEKVVEKGEPE
jgi:peptidoglycan hydrolase FlgJ